MNKKDKQEQRKKFLLASKNLYRYLHHSKKEIDIVFEDHFENNLSGIIIGGSKNSIIITKKNSEIALIYLFSIKYITFQKSKNIEAIEIYDISKQNKENNHYIHSGAFLQDCIDKKHKIVIYFNDQTKIITSIHSVGKYDIVVEIDDQIIILETAKIAYIEKMLLQEEVQSL